MLFSKNQFCGLGLKLMQPSAVERLDFEKHQTGASIGSIHWRKCNLLQWSDWILKSIKLEHPLAHNHILKMLFSKNQFCGLGVKLMQPSAVERLDFERRQSGASIGSQSHS
ncbi:hypothetical protein [Flavobacterium sp. M31R6]|uniref:hypothetical protein n=1 Tax=Flavobacterium sp. M31R6 TaxID=2739062 RepID=UPI00156A534E|nr:hypothetical protein [Flavobacterium sp. M31R6]QKJ62300.1 hypothetical protein HQN62_03830 [Flavobacterium sp. M31R6]